MKRLRWLLALLAALLLATGGMAAWAYGHRGYSRPVYHIQFTMFFPGQPLQTGDVWSDPARGFLRFQEGDGQWTLNGVVAGGHFYRSQAGSNTPVQAQPGNLTAQFRALAQGGYRALGAFLLAHASGPVEHRRLGGYQVVRFPSITAPLDPFTFSWVILWLDARTLAPVQWQFDEGKGTYVTLRYLRLQRLAPNTLPAAFFDPSQVQPSPWCRFTDWLRDHVYR